ncbi:MAG: PDDEXK nuclease domain-containing protein [Tenericutes bacterium]|nr:PDDEXK nuclease domain-containing protein [Mycoplasmatota bacterium]
MDKDYKKELIELVEKAEVNKGYHDYFKNKDLVNNYFEIGKLLIEAQGGEEHDTYGNKLIKTWSVELTEKFGKGYDASNLRRFRQFYSEFKMCGTVCHTLTWSNIRILLPIKNENKRNYYINMCIKKNLSARELKKEIKNNAFERLSLADKENIKLISDKNEVLTIKDTLKDPVLIPINEDLDNISEEKLAKIIRKELEIFLLELGCGYTYAGKEVRMGESYCDLLFFNTEFLCYVVIELKTRKIKKEDIGQLEYYVNYVDENMKKESFNPTIGVLVAKEGNYLVMKYCTNKNIYKTTYKIINEKQKLLV